MPNDASGRKGGVGGLQKLSGNCAAGAWRPQTTPTQPATHHSVNMDCLCLLFIQRLMAAESPLIPLHSTLTKRASAQAKTCTGENVSWDS